MSQELQISDRAPKSIDLNAVIDKYSERLTDIEIANKETDSKQHFDHHISPINSQEELEVSPQIDAASLFRKTTHYSLPTSYQIEEEKKAGRAKAMSCHRSHTEREIPSGQKKSKSLKNVLSDAKIKT